MNTFGEGRKLLGNTRREREGGTTTRERENKRGEASGGRWWEGVVACGEAQ